METKETAFFKTTPCYTQATERLRMFYLRGQDVDAGYLQETGILNKIYEVESAVHVINILGYVMNKPLKDFKSSANELEKLLETGDVCMFSDATRKHLDKVVQQMKGHRRFELIPLVVAMDKNDPRKSFETVLIKVYSHRSNRDWFFVDMSARIYKDFSHYLTTNILPPAVLCYPRRHPSRDFVEFDARNELLVDCCEVGKSNAEKSATDVLVGLVGAVGIVGSIFATGGLAAPFVVASCTSAAYGTLRGIDKLMDEEQHGMSLNPFENPEARNNWLMVSANLLTFASLGVTATVNVASKMTNSSVNGTNLGRLMLANRIIRGVSAGVNSVAVVDSIAYTVVNWRHMSIYEKISLACAVCFCFRQVISFVNAERLIRASQIDGICKFFRGCSDSVVGGVSTGASSFVTNVKRTFDDNEEYVAAAMRLIKSLVQDSFDVTVSDDFVHIRLFGFEYKMRNIISMPESQFNKFMYMIQGIAKTLRDGFALLRKFFGDGPIATAVFKRAEERGGNRADYGTAINELIELFQLVRRISDDFSILSDAELQIGAGHRFTIGSAFNTFVKGGVGRGISLLRALLEMNGGEIVSMNNLRRQWGSKEDIIFHYVTYQSADSAEILSKIRFLLQVSAICTEKSLRITDLLPSEQIVEVESLVCINPEQFRKAVHKDYLIDTKLRQICQPAMQNHREFIETIWRDTCVRFGPEDKAFEKLAVLEAAFQSRGAATIDNVISYVSGMHCPNFCRFVTHSLFAMDSLQSVMREKGLSEPEANADLFSDLAPLRSRFQELTATAKQNSSGIILEGYHTVNAQLWNADSDRLIAAVKELASQEVLRFGTIENGAWHVSKYPMLRLGSEVQKFNRYIARKKFTLEEVQIAYPGKRMVFLGNDQLKIVVGVVQGVGVYIDTFKFTHVD